MNSVPNDTGRRRRTCSSHTNARGLAQTPAPLARRPSRASVACRPSPKSGSRGPRTPPPAGQIHDPGRVGKQPRERRHDRPVNSLTPYVTAMPLARRWLRAPRNHGACRRIRGPNHPTSALPPASPAHETRQHEARRQHAVAENQSAALEPDKLENQPARPGNKEDERNSRPPKRMRHSPRKVREVGSPGAIIPTMLFCVRLALAASLTLTGAAVQNPDDDSPLIRAAASGDIGTVRQLLTRGDVDANITSASGTTPLFEAARTATATSQQSSSLRALERTPLTAPVPRHSSRPRRADTPMSPGRCSMRR